MLKRALSVSAVLALAAGISFGGGGKIKWSDCKSDKDFDKAVAECRQSGTPIMVLFMSDMCPACQGLCSGALSNDEVVKTSEKFYRVLANDGKLSQTSKKYGIKSIPSLLFLDSEGKELARGGNSAESLVRQMNEVALKVVRAPKWSEDAAAALAAAKEASQPALVYLTDDGARAQAADKVFGDLAVADFYGKFAWARVTTEAKSDEAKKYGVTSLPVLLVLDPRAEDPAAKPLKKIALPRPAANLKADLAAVLKDYAKATETK